MEKLTSKVLMAYVPNAYNTAKDQGFYPSNIPIAHCLMMIVTEMGEAVQADRKGKYGSIKKYNEILAVEPNKAYEKTLEGTVESELADVGIRIMSLLGFITSKSVAGNFLEDDILDWNYSIGKTLLNGILTEDLFYLIQIIIWNDIAHSPLWLMTIKLQEVLAYLFAIAHNRDIDLLEYIRLKMRYNESREYKHGYKY